MNQIKIRSARPEDYATVERLMQQVQNLHAEWRPDIYRRCELMLPQATYLEMIADETFLVAERDGEVVGLLYYLRRCAELPSVVRRDILYVDSVAVKETCRGQGIGKALFAYLRAVARECGAAAIELRVAEQNTAAQKMYAAVGFQTKARTMELRL